MAETALRKELLDPFLEQGIQDTNFFNGRLLTAGDLATVQQASRSRDRQLGLAVGVGVVQGLEVHLLKDGGDGKPPVLSVARGLAFNRLGQAVALAQNVEVQLAKKEPENGNNGKSAFALCQPPQNGQPVPGKGAYVFVARPAADYVGQAPRRGFGQAAKVEGCDRDLVREGVQFRLVSMDVATLDKLAPATRADLAQLLKDVETSGLPGLQAQSKLRNWLAHVCFGTEELAALVRDPFARIADAFFAAAVRSPFHDYGALDALRRQGLLDDCDVPLALVCWTAGGVKWVDTWSVRRRSICGPISTAWPLPLSERRQVEAEAMFQQFQEQIGFLLEKLNPAQSIAAHATSLFKYLPAVGFLPVAQGPYRGFDPANFVDLPHRDTEYIDGASLHALCDRAHLYAPVDVNSDELIWMYQSWQNAKAIDDGENPRPYVVLTTGHMPHWAVARLDVARWDYSQYADSGGLISAGGLPD